MSFVDGTPTWRECVRGIGDSWWGGAVGCDAVVGRVGGWVGWGVATGRNRAGRWTGGSGNAGRRRSRATRGGRLSSTSRSVLRRGRPRPAPVRDGGRLTGRSVLSGWSRTVFPSPRVSVARSAG